jgi:rubrerythrin
MSMIKRGRSDGEVVVSSSVFVCNSCGYTEIASGDGSTKECPKCKSEMKLVSSSAESSKE